MLDPNILEQSYSYFLAEAQDLLQTLEQDLLLLKTDRTPARVHSLMRAAHTLKGAAASVGAESIRSIAHSLEDVLKALYRPEVPIDPELEALLFEGYECLRLPIAAAVAQTQYDDTEALNRANRVLDRLKTKLGHHFDPQAALPSSVELGFDITQSLFETGVNERLDQLAAVLSSNDSTTIAQAIQTQAEVFVGLAESLQLPGFGAIAQTTLTALKTHPNEAITIAQLALEDLRRGQVAVLSGDRSCGGEPSNALQQYALGASKGVAPTTRSKVSSKTRIIEIWHQVIDFLNQPVWGTQIVQPSILSTPTPKSGSQQSTLPNHISGLTDDSLIDLNQISIEPEMNGSPSSDTLQFDHSIELQLEEFANQIQDLDISSDALHIDLFHDDSQSSNVLPAIDHLSNSLKATFPITEKKAAPIQSIAVGYSESSPKDTLKDVSPLAVTVRVDLANLESLNHSVGELLINQNRQMLQAEQSQRIIQELSAQVRQHQQTLSDLRDWCDRQLITSERVQPEPLPLNTILPNQFDALELDRYGELHIRLQSALEELVPLETITTTIDQIAQQSDQVLRRQGRVLTHVRNDLLVARMIPIGTIFNRFPQLVQQLIKTYGKSVELKLKGAEVLVDKAIAEKLFDPLLHLVRNAFDHGIEPAKNRQQQGKPEIGCIEIAAYQQGNRTIIEVKDDGQGLDLEKICQRAFDLQLLSSAQVDHFSNAELLDLLFEPGFSTVCQVSDLSGRGVGLDVVRSQLRTIKGSVTARSERHQGTTFSLHLPLMLTTARLLICRVGGAVYALLSDTIETILLPEADQIEHRTDQTVLHWRKDQEEQTVPFYQFSNLFQYAIPLVAYSDLTQNPGLLPILEAKTQPVLILPWNKGYLGLAVDQILGEQELVIRPLSSTIGAPSYVCGCSTLGDGRLTLVIDSVMLAQQELTQAFTAHTRLSRDDQKDNLIPAYVVPSQATSANIASSHVLLNAKGGQFAIDAMAQHVQKHQILVVDDSVTVRQMLALTLQKAGYRVLQAQDGLEAIVQLQQHPIDLVTCDVEMPRLNGFEFLMRHKQESSQSHIPVMMLTSRSSEKHRQLALQLGASAYLTKPYADHELLKTVSDLISFVPS
ncbi:MAG TPA: hybrid sensor histidine kinase/response regulator [Trichocoleus sp.]|jgi:chemotaxis protein histidine kinase CheA